MKSNAYVGNNCIYIDSKNQEYIGLLNNSKCYNIVKGVNKIENSEVLYNAVVTLTGITKTPNFDITIFKAMDKVCQMLYTKHKEI